MKKLLKTIPLLLLVCCMLVPHTSVMASPIETRTVVTISASVPNGFDAEITVSLENSITLIRKAVILNKKNGYTAQMSYFSDNTYIPYVFFSDYGNWKTDLKEEYWISGEEQAIHFTVKDGNVTNVYENDGEIQTDVELGNDYDPDTQLLKGEVAMKRFLSVVSCMENNSEYDAFLKIYGADQIKKAYLRADEKNTEARWNVMTDFERFVWRVGYNQPQLYMFDAESEEDYIEDAIAVEKNKLKAYAFENSDEIYDALVELCSWQYNYFLVTGNIYDYYNAENNIVLPKEEIETEADSTEDTTPNTESGTTAEPESANKFVLFFEKSWVTLVLLLIGGVAFFVVKEKNKRANIYDETDK